MFHHGWVADLCRISFPFLVPVNKGLHWSLCVVVNPGAIKTHSQNLDAHDSKGNPPENMDAPFPCLLFLDALKMHNMNAVGKNIRKWLNSEWARLQSDDGRLPSVMPFNIKTMLIKSPQVPRQSNAYDCGVFVCRYGFGLLRISSRAFSYEECGQFVDGETLFEKMITNDEAFEFDMGDIERIRGDMKKLIERLSNLYLPFKAEQVRKKKNDRMARKAAQQKAEGERKENASSDPNALLATSHTSVPEKPAPNPTESSGSRDDEELETVEGGVAKISIGANAAASEDSLQTSASNGSDASDPAPVVGQAPEASPRMKECPAPSNQSSSCSPSKSCVSLRTRVQKDSSEVAVEGPVPSKESPPVHCSPSRSLKDDDSVQPMDIDANGGVDAKRASTIEEKAVSTNSFEESNQPVYESEQEDL